MPTTIDQAIILRHWDYSETSQTVSLLTRGQGLLRGLAKGSRRQPSAFSGGFETLTQGEVIAIVKPSAELVTITAWDLEEIFWGPRRSLPAHHAGLYEVDVVRHAIIDHDPHPRLFDALAQSLRDLEWPELVERTMLTFQWTLLREIGLTPRLLPEDADRSCRAWSFSPREGGVVGPAQGGRASSGAWRVRRETLELLASIDLSGDEHPVAAESGDRATARASRLLSEFLRVALDVDLATRKACFGPSVPDRIG